MSGCSPPEGVGFLRGIRGATTVDADEPHLVLAAVRDLLEEMRIANGFRPEELAALIFTLTPDIKSAFPARAARELGWTMVPLIDVAQAPVEMGLQRCIRVLALWNTHRGPSDIRHVYLHGASSLRPDLKAR